MTVQIKAIAINAYCYHAVQGGYNLLFVDAINKYDRSNN